ncbi:MAG: HAD family hydrolase [Rhodoferax sp.]
MSHSIEAVVFDMDGVLIDSELHWQQVREEFARDLGQVWESADQRATMGANTASWAATMAERLHTQARAGLDAGAVAQEIIRRMQAKYQAHLPLREGALEAVRQMATRYPVALATGSPTALAEFVLHTTGLDRLFAAAMYGDDVAHGKPAPDIYVAVLQRLGVAPQRAVGIEDSGNGIRALHAAGMRIIAAPTPEFPLAPELLALADATIDRMTALDLALIERLDARHA